MGHQHIQIGHLVRHPGPAARPRFQPRRRNRQHFARQFAQLHARHGALQAIDRRRHPQRLARRGIPALCDIPCRVQSGLVIHQPHPECRQCGQMGHIATIRPAHFNIAFHPRLGEDRGQMIRPIAQRGRLPGQRWQVALQKIAETLPQSIDIAPVAVDEIHGHIQNVIRPGFKSEPRLKHPGQHAGARIIQPAPDARAPAFMPVRLALEKRRTGEQRGCHRLQRQRHAHLLHHVGLGTEIQINLHRTGPVHHLRAVGAHAAHVICHQAVAPLWHHRHLAMRPFGRCPHAQKPHAHRPGDFGHLGQMVAGFCIGLMHRIKHGAG